MKIWITGGKGQLAGEIESILKNGRSQIGEMPQELKNVQTIFTDIEELDISDYNKTAKFVNKEKPDIIINCAAFTNVDRCEDEPKNAFSANSLAPKNLAVAAAGINAKLMHVSTDYVFKGDAQKPYCEWDECNPITAYGRSKLLGERYVKQLCGKYFIVRTAWLYGRRGNNFVKTIRKAAAEKQQLTVVCDQKGNPTNANDLAHHMLKIILTEDYGIYHCTGNGEATWCDFAKEIVALSGIRCEVLPCSSEEYVRKAKRPAYSVLAHYMLEKTVGDEMRDWKEALKSFADDLI